MYVLVYLLWTFLLLGLLWLGGRPVARQLPVGLRRSLPFCYAMAAGLALWMVLLFLLATVGLYTVVWLRVVAVATVLAGAATLWVDGWAPAAPRARISLPLSAVPLLLGLAIVGGGLFLQALRPDVAWDANVYHLTLPRIFLERGGFERIPFNVYSNWPLNLDLLFGLAMALRDRVLAKLLHFLLAAGVCLALLRTTSRLATPWAGALAVTLFLFNPVVLYEARVAYVDIGYAFLFLVSFLALCRGLDVEAERRSCLLAAGVGAGLVAGMKLNGFFAAFCLALLWIVARRRSLRVALLRELPLFLLPVLLLALPWLIKSALFTGNPVYPLLFGLFGGPEWSSELAELHSAWQRSIGMGREPLDYLLLPKRVILDGELGSYGRFDGEISPAWSLLLPAALAGLWSSSGAVRTMVRRGLGVAGLYFVLWGASSQQMRFLIPILPLLALAAALSIQSLLSRLPSKWPRLAAWPVALVAALLLLQASAVYLRQTGRLVRDYQRYGFELHEAVVHPVYRVIDERLPPDARLLLINTNHGFFLERDFIADSFFEASQISRLLADLETVDGVRARLGDWGVSHVLVENRAVWLSYPPPLVALLRDRERAPAVWQSPDGRFSLLELAVGDGRSSSAPPTVVQ